MGVKQTKVEVYPKPDSVSSSIQLLGDRGAIALGSSGTDGKVLLYDSGVDSEPYAILSMDAGSGRIIVSGSRGVESISLQEGSIVLRDESANERITLSSSVFGASILLRDEWGKDSITMDGSRGSISLRDREGKEVLLLDPVAGDGKTSALFLGVGKSPGELIMRDKKGKDSITMDGSRGSISLRDREGKEVLLLDPVAGDGKTSALFLGVGKSPGELIMRDGEGNDSIIMKGAEGDIILNNADCAEDFDISESGEIEPGTVMVIAQEDKLRQSTVPYDSRVVGVISGAGDHKPGLVLDRKYSQDNRKPVALMGKVYCKVDAQSSSIEVGDLLTTSSIPGHAMKAADPLRAFGAVIGKALRSLKEGRGIIPILIALQ